MAKSVTPGSFDLNGRPIFANAVPDSFDARDLIYEPRLDMLPRNLDPRPRKRWYIYRQDGMSCTGHALAAVINHALDLYRPRERVSPYMLYRLARRYDDLPGERDAGSSLRGAFKGWFNHGVALEEEWGTLGIRNPPDVDAEDRLRAWRERPLGAFYRVNPFRLDDVQSAISELTAIAVSGTIHDGWLKPNRVARPRPDGTTEVLHVIARGVPATSLGGHAFTMIGYNDVGFLIQNSWGKDWGDGGFAYLPYEDWLDSAYDAWVARPGVPQTPLYSGRTRTVETAGAALTTEVGPDIRRLSYHVLNTGNDGKLSEDGKFKSSAEQLGRVMGHMEAWHEFFLKKGRTKQRHIVVWAHGGGVSEKSGLDVAERSLNWWLNCGAFPITCVWETGPIETFADTIKDLVAGFITSIFGFDISEQIDTRIEKGCRKGMRWSWRQMKDNARRASGSAQTAGATMLVRRLKEYVNRQAKGTVQIHLVAHSAGSIYQAAMVERMAQEGLTATTMTWLGPAITVAEFRQRVLPNLGPGKTVERFACFDLSDALELNDTVGPIYNKSAVYLVARGFEEGLGERDAFGNVVTEVPVLGLSKWWDQPLDQNGTKLVDLIGTNGELIKSRNGAPLESRSDATTHADLDGDSMTMTSVAFRSLGIPKDPNQFTYTVHAPLLDVDHDAPWPLPSTEAPIVAAPPAPEAVGAGGRRGGGRGATRRARQPREGDLLPRAVETDGDTEFVAAAPPVPPQAPPKPPTAAISPEVAVAPRSGRPILDVLRSLGMDVDLREAPKVVKHGGI